MPIEPDDVIHNKAAIIERCISRIHREYEANPKLDNYTHIDALTLNVERACQACIDLAMHIVAQKHLGMPQASGDAFTLLRQNGIIEEALEKSMRAMTGFRNIAVHQYRELDMAVLRHIALEGWRDWLAFCRQLGLKLQITPTHDENNPH